MDRRNVKALLVVCAVALAIMLAHFASYVANGRKAGTMNTRNNGILTQESVSPYYDAVLHFLGDPDLK